MITTIIYNVILLPLVMGVLLSLAVLGMRNASLKPVAILLAGVVGVVIYWLLEGVPSWPIVASKGKIALLIAAAPVVFAVLSVVKMRLAFVSAVIAAVGLYWIGINKVADMDNWARIGVLFVPSLLLMARGLRKPDGPNDPFLWPVTLLMFFAGAALMSVLGAYIGLGQMLGAFAAATGGFVLVNFIAALMGKPIAPSEASGGAVWALAAMGIAVSQAAGLFAPSANTLALFFLSLVCFTPAVAARFSPVSPALRPFAIAAIAAVPLVIALAITFI